MNDNGLISLKWFTCLLWRIIIFLPKKECIFTNNLIVVKFLKHCVQKLVRMLESEQQKLESNISISNNSYLCIRYCSATKTWPSSRTFPSTYFLRIGARFLRRSSFNLQLLVGPPEYPSYLCEVWVRGDLPIPIIQVSTTAVVSSRMKETSPSLSPQWASIQS